MALKTIRAGESADDEQIARFRLEAESAARLEHSGIVPIYEIGEQQGLHYIAMAYVEGTSLAAALKEGPLSPRDAAEILHEIALAVHYAHTRKILHRDLKPHNVLLDREGHPKVADFGLAKRLDVPDGQTMSGQLLGTPRYMAPEQALAKKDLGPATDVYGLGAIFYETLTGRPPIQAAALADILKQVVEQEPVPVRQLTPAVPRDLETICLKCLQKDPTRRYASRKIWRTT